LMVRNKTTLQKHLNQLQITFEIEVQGNLDKYIWIKFDKHTDGTIQLSQ
jgi:hypothetical protein